MSTDSAFPTPNNLGIAVYSNNADAIGNTPLVRINRVISAPATVLAKIESRNPTFSVKCRIGAALINDAEKSGKLSPASACTIPTTAKFGKSRPLAIVCVPIIKSTMPECNWS